MRGSRRAIETFVLVGLALAAARAAPAQQPRVENAKIETRSAAAGLEKEFRSVLTSQAAPAWVGYAVPAIASRHQMCCGSWDGFSSAEGMNCGHCYLESDAGAQVSRGENSAVAGTSVVHLEGPEHLLVLFRMEQKRVDRIRTFSEDCQLNAGGLPFVWLTDVQPAESVTLLSSFAVEAEPKKGEGSDDKGAMRLSKHAVTAIALHNDSAADRALASFTAPTQPEWLQSHAAFWLGEARGAAGLAVLRRMANENPSEHVRAKVVFAMSVSREPGAIDDMIHMARSDSSAQVRGQALFWLAHKAGSKAAATITSAIENDPETEVKKRAVFALSQLPREEGVPLLIQVARNNRNPAVRKQAMFWLGQSHDPRALTFFEEVLKR